MDRLSVWLAKRSICWEPGSDRLIEEGVSYIHAWWDDRRQWQPEHDRRPEQRRRRLCLLFLRALPRPEFLSEESRRMQCRNCRNFHLWICTKRSKAKARWCQVRSQHVLLGHFLTKSTTAADLLELCACMIVLSTMLARMVMDGCKMDI